MKLPKIVPLVEPVKKVPRVIMIDLKKLKSIFKNDSTGKDYQDNH